LSSHELAKEIIDIAAEFNLEARVIGRCEAAPEKKLTILTPEESFVFS
jgi:hypothetical protein